MSIEKVRQNMIEGDGDEGVAILEKLLSDGITPQDIMTGLTEEMGILGNRFEQGEAFLPDLMVAGDAFAQMMEVLKPHLTGSGGKEQHTVVIGTVKGDYHDIGKNIVGIVLQANGFNVIDIGTDVDPMDYVEAAEKNNAAVVALSALMTTTMPAQEEFIKMLKETGHKDKFKVCIGGAPTSQDWADRIGADLWSFDAFECANKLKKLFP